MPANLRSVIAQVHRKSRSIRSLHNTPTTNEPKGSLETMKKFGFGFGLGSSVALGCCVSSFLEFYNYYPTLLKSGKERTLLVQRDEELVTKAYLDLLRRRKEP